MSDFEEKKIKKAFRKSRRKSTKLFFKLLLLKGYEITNFTATKESDGVFVDVKFMRDKS